MGSGGGGLEIYNIYLKGGIEEQGEREAGTEMRGRFPDQTPILFHNNLVKIPYSQNKTTPKNPSRYILHFMGI